VFATISSFFLGKSLTYTLSVIFIFYMKCYEDMSSYNNAKCNLLYIYISNLSS